MKIKPFVVLILSACGLGAFALSNAVAQDTQVYDESGASSHKNRQKQNQNEPSGAKEVSFRGIEKATEISKEDAQKKYPPPHGGYPVAETTQGPNTGMSTTVISSPYPPHHRFDTSGINRGALILDPYAKHVFVKP